MKFNIKTRWEILSIFYPELYQDIACYSKGEDDLIEAFNTFGIPEDRNKNYHILCTNKYLREAMEEVLKENWDKVREKGRTKFEEETKNEMLK